MEILVQAAPEACYHFFNLPEFQLHNLVFKFAFFVKFTYWSVESFVFLQVHWLRLNAISALYLGISHTDCP